MRAATTTYPRIGLGYAYCEQTVRSLLSNDSTFQPSDLMVFVDHPIAPVVPEGVRVHINPDQHLALPPTYDYHGLVRLTLNLAQALDWVADGGICGCVFEDDVVMATDWHVRTEAFARAALRRTQCWVMTLTHFTDPGQFEVLAQTGQGSDALRLWRNKEAFWGVQGLCVTASAARHLAMRLRERMVLPYPGWLGWTSDLGVQQVCIREDIPMYCTRPSMCKHVGDVSAVGHVVPAQTGGFEE
jgi:hypothetical protein